MAVANVSTCLLRSTPSHRVLNMLLPYLEPLHLLDDDDDWYVVIRPQVCCFEILLYWHVLRVRCIPTYSMIYYIAT